MLITCLQHNDGLLVLQGSHFPSLLFEWALNAFLFLIVLPPIISCEFFIYIYIQETLKVIWQGLRFTLLREKLVLKSVRVNVA